MVHGCSNPAKGPSRRDLSVEALDWVSGRLQLIGQPTRIRLLWLLEEHGAATIQQLCDLLGPTSHQNVAKHMRALHRSGIVRRTPVGSSVRYELADRSAVRILDEVVATLAARLADQHRQLYTPDA